MSAKNTLERLGYCKIDRDARILTIQQQDLFYLGKKNIPPSAM
jgi:hypothetical protein